jgi:hypothetical protein
MERWSSPISTTSIDCARWRDESKRLIIFRHFGGP